LSNLLGIPVLSASAEATSADASLPLFWCSPHASPVESIDGMNRFLMKKGTKIVEDNSRVVHFLSSLARLMAGLLARLG
jgi:hypothetical protein